MQNPILPVVIYLAFSLLDYFLTLKVASLYKRFASDKIELENGIELNPQLQDAVNHQEPPPPLYIKKLLLTALYILGVYIFALALPWEPMPSFFLFILGAFLIPLIRINLGHLSSIWNFLYVFSAIPSGVSGKIVQKEWFSRKQAAYSLFFIDGLSSLMVFLVTKSYLFLGGSFMFIILAYKYAILSAEGFLASQRPDPALTD